MVAIAPLGDGKHPAFGDRGLPTGADGQENILRANNDHKSVLNRGKKATVA